MYAGIRNIEECDTHPNKLSVTIIIYHPEQGGGFRVTYWLLSHTCVTIRSIIHFLCVTRAQYVTLVETETQSIANEFSFNLFYLDLINLIFLIFFVIFQNISDSNCIFYRLL